MRKVIILLIISLTALTGYAANWGETLQKAVYFYECQQAGPLMAGNRVEWRGNATMNDAVTGGWYDAGDHVKFNLPMAYAASMLGWGEYEYKSALQSSGQLSYYENNLKFVLDYLAACWNGSSYTYQIGDGNNDHTWWGPVECIEKETQAGNRPAASSSTAGCVMAHTAASLAIGNILFGNATYLSKAKQLFSSVDASRSDAGYTAANNFYTSWSGPIDELLWAACWLYLATNDASYLTKAESYVPLLNRQQQENEIEYKWGHCWDDVHYGAMLLLSRITGNAEYKRFIELHLDWWVAGAKGKTPKGLSWLDSWGSLRYASAASFVAFVYSDWSGADQTKAATYRTWAQSQMNYITGNNEQNRSYVVGYGTNPPQHPHHRTAHGSWLDSQQTPPNHRHVLYGALVGGPDQSGGYTDEIGNYTTNEVACDYNAGFAAASIKMYSLSGGSAVANFPAPETKDNEFFCEAKMATQATQTDVTVFCNNRSGWPARMIKNLRFRYYMDLSEVSNPAGVTAATNYVEFPVTITGPTLASGSTYYFQIAFNDGTSIYPGGQSEYSAEVQLRIAAPSGSTWDPANDPSFKGLTGTQAIAPQIPVYDGTTLLFGTDPFSGTPEPTPVVTPVVTPDPGTPVPTIIPEQIPVTIKIVAPAAGTGTVTMGGMQVSGPNGTSQVVPIPQPATVTFTASGSSCQFSSWSGALTGSANPATLNVNGAVTVTANFVEIPPANLGDVNVSGTIDIVDALLIAQYYVGNPPANFVAANADVNRDGSITIVDALRVAQCYVGLIICQF